MLEESDSVEKYIWYEQRYGNASFWHDNWTRFGPLATILPSYFPCDYSINEVGEAMTNRQWNVSFLT